jgi:aldose 1-epimerase
MGNNAYSMTVNGQQIFWSPYKTIAEWKAKPAQIGNPFLAPWCNRIDGDAYWANGKRYLLNAELKNFRKDGNGKPIHGLIVYASDWNVTAVSGGDRGAAVTSRLEFWRDPNRLAQFPWAHNYEMTYRLVDGVLEVETVVENLAIEPMPLSLGYHTYYQLTDAPRDDWKVHLAARDHVVLSNVLVPTGEVKKVTLGDPVALKGTQLDDVFTGLTRESNGRAVFSVEGKKQKLAVEYGPNYPVSVVYAPSGRGFICFEPMAGVTNVFNLGHEGKFPLQSVPAGGRWKESFWIRPSGF